MSAFSDYATCMALKKASAARVVAKDAMAEWITDEKGATSGTCAEAHE